MLQILFFAIMLALNPAGDVLAENTGKPSSDAKLFRYSTTVEKERPELDERTKRLIAAYRKNPTEERLRALRKQAEVNYDKVVARKRAKLEELKKTARHVSKIEEMQEIVDEMIRDRENRINQTIRRFTDSRFLPHAREAKGGYLPVLGAAENVYIAYAPVTNEEYFLFVRETGQELPKGWESEKALGEKGRHPVVNISYDDAASYCEWLSRKDGRAVYRLPTETEWELAAGHMPKDADMNCGKNSGTTPIDAYAQTLSACGAVDMWGNVWEWTSTLKTARANQKFMVVKGGSWSAPRTNCRTEYRKEVREAFEGYDNVGFRVVREVF